MTGNNLHSCGATLEELDNLKGVVIHVHNCFDPVEKSHNSETDIENVIYIHISFLVCIVYVLCLIFFLPVVTSEEEVNNKISSPAGAHMQQALEFLLGLSSNFSS